MRFQCVIDRRGRSVGGKMRGLLVVALAAIMLSGCVTTVPEQNRNIVVGAGVGAGIGALIGHASGGPPGGWAGAAIGAAAGGIVGGSGQGQCLLLPQQARRALAGPL